jgi:hypothetical protein
VAVNSYALNADIREKAVQLAKGVLKSHKKPAIWAGKPKKRLTFTCQCYMCELAQKILSSGKKPKEK